MSELKSTNYSVAATQPSAFVQPKVDQPFAVVDYGYESRLIPPTAFSEQFIPPLWDPDPNPEPNPPDDDEIPLFYRCSSGPIETTIASFNRSSNFGLQLNPYFTCDDFEFVSGYRSTTPDHSPLLESVKYYDCLNDFDETSTITQRKCVILKREPLFQFTFSGLNFDPDKVYTKRMLRVFPFGDAPPRKIRRSPHKRKQEAFYVPESHVSEYVLPLTIESGQTDFVTLLQQRVFECSPYVDIGEAVTYEYRLISECTYSARVVFRLNQRIHAGEWTGDCHGKKRARQAAAEAMYDSDMSTLFWLEVEGNDNGLYSSFVDENPTIRFIEDLSLFLAGCFTAESKTTLLIHTLNFVKLRIASGQPLEQKLSEALGQRIDELWESDDEYSSYQGSLNFSDAAQMYAGRVPGPLRRRERDITEEDRQFFEPGVSHTMSFAEYLANEEAKKHNNPSPFGSVDPLSIESGEIFERVGKIFSQITGEGGMYFVNKILRLFTLACGMVLYTSSGISFGPAIFKLVEDSYFGTIKFGSEIFIEAMKIVSYLCKTGYAVYMSGSLDPLFHSAASYSAWYDEVSELKRMSLHLSCPESQGFSIEFYLNKLSVCIDNGERIIRRLELMKDSDLRYAKMAMDSLKKLDMEYKASDYCMCPRVVPFSALIFGSSGIGKTSVRNILMHYFSQIRKKPHAPTYIYNVNANSAFFDGFKAWMWGVSIDDIARLNPKAAPQGDPTLACILDLVNGVPFIPNMAALEEKGRTPVRAEMVVATTNTKNLNAFAYYKAPQAILRRFPFVILPTVRLPYTGEDGMSLDPQKAPPTSEGDYPDLWQWTVEKVDLSGDNVTYTPIMVDADMSTFLLWFRLAIMKHFEIQEKVEAARLNMDKMTICPTCFLMGKLCQCGTLPTLSSVSSVSGASSASSVSLSAEPFVLSDERKAYYDSRWRQFIQQEDSIRLASEGCVLEGSCFNYFSPTTRLLGCVGLLFGLPICALGVLSIWEWSRKRQRQGFDADDWTIQTPRFPLIPLHPDDWHFLPNGRVVTAPGQTNPVFDLHLEHVDDYPPFGPSIPFRVSTIADRGIIYDLHEPQRQELPENNGPLVSEGRVEIALGTTQIVLLCSLGFAQGLIFSYLYRRYSSTLRLMPSFFTKLNSIATACTHINTAATSASSVRERFIEMGRRAQNALPPPAFLLKVASGVVLAVSFYGIFKMLTRPQLRMEGSIPTKPVAHEREPVATWKKDDFPTRNIQVQPATNCARGVGEKDLFDKIKNQTVFFVSRGGGRMVSGRGLLTENYMICSSHCVSLEDTFTLDVVLQPNAGGLSSNQVITLKQRHVYRSDDSDLCLVFMEGLVSRKKISQWLVRASHRAESSAVYFRREPNGEVTTLDLDRVRFVAMESQTLNKTIHGWHGVVSSETGKGNCGMPLILNTVCGPAIGGVHVAGNTNEGASVLLAMSSSISLEWFENAKEQLLLLHKKLVVESVEGFPADLLDSDLNILPEGRIVLGGLEVQSELGDLHAKAPVRFIEENGSLDVYGSLSGFRSTHASDVQKTPMNDYWARCGHICTKVAPDLTSWRPKRKALLDITAADNSIDLDILSICVHQYTKEILDLIPKDELKEVKPMDRQSAINGVPGVTYIDGINKSTSSGYPWRQQKIRKLVPKPLTPLDIALGYQEVWDCDAEIDGRIARMMESYLAGECAHPIFCGQLKDEPISQAKADAGETRVFVSAPMDFTILMRQFLLPFVRLVQNNKFVFEAGPGTAAQSDEWEDIYQYLTSLGLHRFIAGDYKKFDKKMASTMMMAAFRVILLVCLASGNFDEDDMRVLRGIATDVSFSTVDFFGELLRFIGSNPSGHPLTVILNGIVNSLYLRYCYYLLNPMREVHSFRFNTRVMTYGDDNIMSVRTGCDWFNHTSIVAILATIGVTYTMADKLATSVPYVHIDTCSFLKRSWRWEPELQVHVCPIERESISKCLMVWVKSRVLTDKPHMVSCLLSAHWEAFFQGREFFEIFDVQAKACVVEFKLESWMPERGFLSWFEYIARWRNASEGYIPSRKFWV